MGTIQSWQPYAYRVVYLEVCLYERLQLCPVHALDQSWNMKVAEVYQLMVQEGCGGLRVEGRHADAADQRDGVGRCLRAGLRPRGGGSLEDGQGSAALRGLAAGHPRRSRVTGQWLT